MIKTVFLSLVLVMMLPVLRAFGGGSLDKLDGSWRCDGSASLEYLPATERMAPVDRELWAEQLDAMGVQFNVAEQSIALNLGNLRGVRSFTVLSEQGLVVELLADETFTIEIKDDATILFSDPIDEEKKVVLKRP